MTIPDLDVRYNALATPRQGFAGQLTGSQASSHGEHFLEARVMLEQ